MVTDGRRAPEEVGCPGLVGRRRVGRRGRGGIGAVGLFRGGISHLEPSSRGESERQCKILPYPANMTSDLPVYTLASFMTASFVSD